MVSHAISWVPGTHVRFGDLDFIVMVGGELALAHVAIQSLPSIGFNYGNPTVSPLDPGHLGRTCAMSPSLQNTPHGAPRQCFNSVSTTPW